MQIRTILYQYTKTLIKHVFLLNFTYELLMSFKSNYKSSDHSQVFIWFRDSAFRVVIGRCEMPSTSTDISEENNRGILRIK